MAKKRGGKAQIRWPRSRFQQPVIEPEDERKVRDLRAQKVLIVQIIRGKKRKDGRSKHTYLRFYLDLKKIR